MQSISALMCCVGAVLARSYIRSVIGCPVNETLGAVVSSLFKIPPWLRPVLSRVRIC